MVQLPYSVLAIAFISQLVSAFPKPDADSTLQQRQAGPNDQFVFAICPRSPQKCSQCGGDSRKKGFCDNEIATGYRSDYNRCVRWHGEGEGCGLICECISEETGKPGAGAPPIIPFPPIPVGFVPPPAAVPNPKTEESCGNDYTKTSCKDCEPLDGWCTKGEKAGCPCREECPADDDDNKPSCSADDCKGEQGSCTIGHHKGCKCKSECPNPDKKILVCSDDTCKSEKDNKCTTDEYNGCDCYHLTKDYYTMRSKAQVQSDTAAIAKLVESMKKFYDEQGEEDDEPKDPEVTCASKDYSEAVEVDASFLNKLADKFCSGDTDKKRSQDLTAKDISSGAYENYKFHFELDPGDDCKTDCKAAFKSMTSKCQGLDSHSIQKSASAKIPDCGASFSYEITVPEAEEAPDTFIQEGEQERVCHTIEEIGSHGDVRGGEMSRAALMCLSVEDDKAQFTSGSEPVTRTMESGGTQYAITMSWVDNCEGDSQDVRYPHGKENNTLGDTCWMLMLHNWEDCTGNKGAGGYIDYGCVRYDFRPTFD